MTEPRVEEETPTKACPMCAGSGKVRDYVTGMTPFAAGTYQTIDFENINLADYLISPIYGT